MLWNAISPSNPWNAETIGDIPVPNGYKRVAGASGSYTEFLRSLPLKRRGCKVKLYTGGNANFQWLSAAVVDIPLLSNSEQCADMTMRLRAEWLYSHGRYSEISFKTVNGKTLRYHGGANRKSLNKFLRQAYGQCSTYSVFNETRPITIKDLRPGDVFVYKARKLGGVGACRHRCRCSTERQQDSLDDCRGQYSCTVLPYPTEPQSTAQSMVLLRQ